MSILSTGQRDKDRLHLHGFTSSLTKSLSIKNSRCSVSVQVSELFAPIDWILCGYNRSASTHPYKPVQSTSSYSSSVCLQRNSCLHASLWVWEASQFLLTSVIIIFVLRTKFKRVEFAAQQIIRTNITFSLMMWKLVIKNDTTWTRPYLVVCTCFHEP